MIKQVMRASFTFVSKKGIFHVAAVARNTTYCFFIYILHSLRYFLNKNTMEA